MKRTNRTIALFIALIMILTALAAVACTGKNGESGGEPGGDRTSRTANPTETPTSKPTSGDLFRRETPKPISQDEVVFAIMIDDEKYPVSFGDFSRLQTTELKFDFGVDSKTAGKLIAVKMQTLIELIGFKLGDELECKLLLADGSEVKLGQLDAKQFSECAFAIDSMAKQPKDGGIFFKPAVEDNDEDETYKNVIAVMLTRL